MANNGIVQYSIVTIKTNKILTNLLTEITALGQSPSITKQESIITGILTCIENGQYKLGDNIPSVNELSKELGYARETIVKSYNLLKQRGIIKSKQGVGFFVASDNTNLRQSVALVLYGFQTFQQDFYNTFRKTLGKHYHLDVFFHHNNDGVYSSILDSIHGNYGMYVIAPIQSSATEKMLTRFNSDRLLIIDRYQYVGERVSKVTQEFEQSLLSVFDRLDEEISAFDRIVLYYQKHLDYPIEILNATKQYCDTCNYELMIEEEFDPVHLKQGTLFFTIGDADLWAILKAVKSTELELGKDIGILSHNDSPVKEIINGGITTFSTDFNKMAIHAASFVKKRDFTNRIIPSKLIKRKSL